VLFPGIFGIEVIADVWLRTPCKGDFGVAAAEHCGAMNAVIARRANGY
jgi:hypothetical protein